MYDIQQIHLLGKDSVRVATVLPLDGGPDAGLVHRLTADRISGRRPWMS